MRFIQVVDLLLSRNLECAAKTENTEIQEQLENRAMKLEILNLSMKKQNEEILDSLDKLSMMITGSAATE